MALGSALQAVDLLRDISVCGINIKQLPEALSKGGRKKEKFRGKGDEDESKKVEARAVTKFAQDFYPKLENPPTPRMRLPKFGDHSRIRIQEAGTVWSLIVLLDFKGMEGWVESKFITPLPEVKPK